MRADVPVIIVLALGRGAEAAIRAEVDARRFDNSIERYAVSDTLPEFLKLSDESISRQSVIIVSEGPSTQHDQEVEYAVTECLRWNVPVYFVFDPRQGHFNNQAPVPLHHINAIALDDRYDATHVVTQVLRLMEIEEGERSVFISYAQQDGSAWAYELRRVLVDEGWDVFLDRISIDPGVDFQKTLARDLDGRSLVLVVESPLVASRPWVTWELTYARDHAIGLMSFATETIGAVLGGQVEEDRRFVAKGVLGGTTKLDQGERNRLLREVQYQHSTAWRTRRRSALEEAGEALVKAGYTLEPLQESAFSAEKAGHRRIVVHVTPRSPRAGDLRSVHQLRGTKSRRHGSDGWVVHTHRLIDPEQESLLRWLTKRRPLTVAYVGEFGKKLR
jgi:hypothetical protein